MLKKNISKSMAIVLIFLFVLSKGEIRQTENENSQQNKISESYVNGKVYGCSVRRHNHNYHTKWNLDMINVDKNSRRDDSVKKIKVAVLDSGIDLGNDISYIEQRNFVEKEEVSPFFVDDTGHGTSVAGLIAAKDNKIGITGIAPNVGLYSARVLSKNDSGDIMNVIDAIHWAIQKKVNIINMSFSTKEDNILLHNAICEAYKKGILIIAASGNDSVVDYPAAYPEVLSVGAVNSNGKVSEFSASAEKVELLAPGERVTASGLQAGEVVLSGTSLSAPQVTAVAALLWSKDASKSSSFIRALLDASANKNGLCVHGGNGILDYKKAEEIYDNFEENYPEMTNSLLNMSEIENKVDNYLHQYGENESELDVVEKNNSVVGQWQNHDNLTKKYTSVKSFQNGGRAPDELQGLKGLNENHAWHGGMYSNYVADYCYLVEVAKKVGGLPSTAKLNEIKSAIKKVSQNKGMSSADMDNIRKNSSKYKNSVYSQMQNDLVSYVASKLVGMSKENRKAYIFGIASHIATDCFSHATYRYDGNSWKYISHVRDSNGKLLTANYLYADNPNCVSRRYTSALQVLRKVVNQYNGKSGNVVRDFLIESTATRAENRIYYSPKAIKYVKNAQNEDATFRMKKFKQYQKDAGETDVKVLDVYYGVTF